jgi:hypothetical protein
VLGAVEGLQVRRRFSNRTSYRFGRHSCRCSSFQQYGTHRVGGLFGPIMLLWFITIAGWAWSGSSATACDRALNPFTRFVISQRTASQGSPCSARCSGGDRRRSAVCRHGSFRQDAIRCRVVLAGVAGAAAELSRARGAAADRRRRREAAFLSAGALMGLFPLVGIATLRRSSPRRR